MAMTVQQAQDLVTSTVNPQDTGGGLPDIGAPGTSGGGGGGNFDPRDASTWDTYKALGVDPNFLAMIARARSDLSLAQQLSSAGINPYADPADSYFALSPQQLRLFGFGSATNNIAPPTQQDVESAKARISSGNYSASDVDMLQNAGLLTPTQAYKLLFGATGGAGGGVGGTGSDHYASDRAAATQLAQLEEQKRQFGLTFPEQQREFDLQQQLAQQQAQQGYLQNRATTGLNLGQFAQSLANDQYQRALDPGNYPAYLAASAGLPQGAGSPISALIGQGTQITPLGGSNPLADPRFQNLLGNLYEYAQPGALQTVQGIAANNGGQLPQAFYDYTHTQNPNVPAHASGGNQVITGPVYGIPASELTQQQHPQFLAGEAGPEQIQFHPMHTHDTNGMPMPHQHQYGEHGHEHRGNVIQFADGGAVIAGTGPTRHQLVAAWNAYHPTDQMPDTTFTPAEGTAISAGRQIGNLGYAPQYLTDQLMEGRTPTPGSLDEATLSRLPPSIRALLQAQIRSALGGAGVMDYNAALQQQALPGLNSGQTYTSYQ